MKTLIIVIWFCLRKTSFTIEFRLNYDHGFDDDIA